MDSPCPSDGLCRGVGFPSASRELARRRPTRKDPNGYYEFLGLEPWASDAEIKTRCRFLMRAHHPDGLYPRRELFERVREIYGVLTDPVTKARYDHTPDGHVYLDRLEMDKLAAAAGARGLDIRDLLEHAVPEHWSYYGDDPDRDLAQAWYAVLLDAAYQAGYRGRIEVALVDPAEWSVERAVEGERVSVPRVSPRHEIASRIFASGADSRG